MEFGKKLSAVMDALSISNSRLAMALSVDTSLISRWRNGSRVPGKKSDHVASIARYLCSVAKMDYQRAALCETMGLRHHGQPPEGAALVREVAQWLSHKDSSGAVDSFLSELAMFRVTTTPQTADIAAPNMPASERPDYTPVQVFYGIPGKREACLRFLQHILAHPTPCKIQLYSDEEMDWIFEDRVFYQRFIGLMGMVIKKGCEITIIHTLSRDIVEMLSSIEMWMPLYMTGSIAPYFYPKYYKSIFTRSMFIGTDVVAMTCETVNSDGGANLLIADTGMLKELKHRFDSFLHVCRPLMRIITPRNLQQSLEMLDEFNMQPGNTVYRSRRLSAYTMPPELYKQIAARAELSPGQREQLLRMQQIQAERFVADIDRHTSTEFICLPEAGQIVSGQIPAPFFGLLGAPENYYTAWEYAQHLRHIVRLIETKMGYSLYLIADCEQEISLQSKEDVGTLVVKSKQPNAIFAFNQPHMSAAFYRHIEEEREKVPRSQYTRRYVVETLNTLIKKLEQHRE